MRVDPDLYHDPATGFVVEHCTSGDPLVGECWIAYSDDRVIYHLHRGNNAIGDSRDEAIAKLAARRTWGIAA